MKKWICFVFLSLLLCAAPRIAQASEPDAYLTLANLNLREAPTMEAEIYLTVPKDTVVWVMDFLDNEWFYVTHETYTGYMKAEYLTAYVPPSEAAPTDVTTVETTVGTVELLDWTDAKAVFTLHTPAQVIDVRTRVTYWVSSFSNGNHADVEPITEDDTAAMKSTYGGKWSWDTRPILVIINGRTLAASINGMPHGGGINNSNGMNGQVCIHFRGSKTHNGNKAHEADHQDAVTEAFNTAQNW